jgi:hypothetical protein
MRTIREATATGCANTDKSQVVSGVHYRLNVITIKVMFRTFFPDCGKTLSKPCKTVNPLSKTAARFFPSRGKTGHSERSRPIFVPPSLLRRSRAAQSRNLFSIPREAKPFPFRSFTPSPLRAPSTSESPLASAAIAPQIPDPSAYSTSAPPDSPASKSYP